VIGDRDRDQDRRRALLQALGSYRAGEPDDEARLGRFRSFLARADPFRRTDPDGHVTASAIVTRPAGDAVLLVSHRKLGGWLQPGGHVDPDDRSVFDAAVREVREETGVDRPEAPCGDAILDLDVHPIPAFGEEPAHVHYDVRFLLTSADGSRPAGGAAWFPVDAIPGLDRDGSLERAVRKAISRLSTR
jgi:8-oxo-dGTP pyrophosphatase MutT (NUDIX family)